MPLQDPSCYPYAVNPPITSHECCVFGGHIDYLYWRPYSDDNAFADVTSVNGTSNFSSSSTAYSNVEKDVDYDWHSGFRIGLDAGVPCNEWRVGLEWTHFLNHNNGNGVAASVNGYTGLTFIRDPAYAYPTLGSIGSNGVSSTAFGRWRVELNEVDLVFGRQFYVGHQVTLRPYGGLRALFLRQRYDAEASFNSGPIFFDGVLRTPIISNLTAELSTDFKGVGIVGGFESTWDVFCDLGLYANFGGSILYGKSRSNLTGILTSTNFSGITNNYFAERNVNTLRATLDLAFGFEWRQELFEDSGEFIFRAGWEEHLYFRQNNFLSVEVDYPFGIVPGPQSNSRSIATQNLADVSFQGLVISAGYTY